MGKDLSIPLEMAELLHATLGPIAASLRSEGNHWADTIEYIVDRYIEARDTHLGKIHGPGVRAEINHVTFGAVEEVLHHMDEMSTEREHFGMWAEEFKGA